MAFDFSNISDEELEAMAAQSASASEPMPQKPLSEWTDEELEAYAAEPTPAPAQSAAHSPRMTREERIAANNRAIERAQQPGDGEDGFDLAVLEGVKGAARAVKDIGGGIVGMVSGAARLAGTPVRLATGWAGLHRLADTIDSSYENFGRDALMSEYGENPDGWGYALGRAGEKVAGVAGSLAALGGVGKAVGVAGTALKTAGHAKTAAAVANTLPLMFGNDAAVRAYDTARANGKSKGESAALAGLNGAIHFLGFKAFENQSLKKMLNIGPEVEVMMPKWANALADTGGQSFSSLVRGTRNGMVKYIAVENGKRALKAGGIMGLQDMLSDPVMQVAEGASIDDIDFSRMLKAGAHGVGEGVLMEGLTGGAAIYKSQKAAEKFIADKYFRGKDYKVIGADGKPHDEPGLLNSSEGRMMLMKQNPDATERVLDIVEHGGTPRPAELDAAFLPPDMTAEELKKFASDWRNDLKPYVDEAWAADAPRQAAAPDAASAKPGRDMLSPEEAQSQQKAANDAAERQKVADRRAAADSMMLDFESWNRLYADGKTDLNFDEWRAAGKPGVIEANLTPKTEEAPTSETRANEEPAQPEQTEVVAPATGAEARPVESAEARAEAADARVVAQPAVWPNGWDNAGEEIKGYVVPNDGDVAPGREVAIAHRSGGSINAPQKIKGVVESVDGDTVKVYYRDGMGYDQHDTFKKSELVGVMPLTAVPTEGATSQTAENRAGAAQEGAGARPASETATTTPAPAKPTEAPSRVSGTENISPNLTKKPAETAKPVAEAPRTDVSATAPAESGNAAPVVENRGDAATVAAPESVEAKIAAMKRGSPEQLKAQREYVEREVAKAKDAIKGKFRPKTGRLSPREKAVDAYERVKNTGDIPKTVNIKVPGDGEITVKNNPNGMAFLDRFAAKFRPHPTSGESAMALPRSPSIKVSDKPKAESAEKELAPFVSKDKTRERMLKPYTEGKMVVATDGRVAVRRPLRKGESVKGADDAPRASQVFGRAEDAATESAAIDVQAIFPKLQQALTLEGSVFVESYEPETGKPTGLRPLAKSHAVELWRDAGGALQVRSRDTDGNSYASDAWSGDSTPVAAFDGKALVEIVRLAAKNGEGKIEVRFAKDAQNNPVLFSFGGYEAALMPLRAKGHFDEARRVDSESARANPAKSAEGAKSASRASDAKSNRLRRADGTDPLAEKSMPKTLQKAVYKISSAIANRTGTGVITSDEAYGIVKGIAESPGTKHNRTRDFFGPLEKDAAWHESMGLDAESAKNIRDAVDRVKTDADLKKWFPLVDAAVKKAKDGKLSKKDAVSLFGKISEGLEKAERMGLSETANRLREAAEVIRPVAETVEQGDVNKFNYSTKGRKLNNRLGGTDKRGGKTVSLDTKDGTVDVAADGKRGTLDGNRYLIIDGVNGDELTVTMKDAAGKTLATRKMNRAQWSALSQGAVATDGDPANPQKGDLIRMSRSDATDAPPLWTPEAQKPLERVAHALRNVVTVGGKKLKVSFADRPADADGQTRKSIGGVFTGTAADYANRSRHGGVDDGPSLHKIGTGEGTANEAWGLYFTNAPGIAGRYANQFVYELPKQLLRKGTLVTRNPSFGGDGKDVYERLRRKGYSNDEVIEILKNNYESHKEERLDRFESEPSVFEKDDLEALDFANKHGNEYEVKDDPRQKHAYVYEQTIFTDRDAADDSHILDWNKKVDDTTVKMISDKLGQNLEGGDGQHIYNQISSILRGKKEASIFLRDKCDIDGVRYQSPASEGPGHEFTTNYISFRDDNIRVDHKWKDGRMRYMRNADGVTVGEYDAARGEIRLYPGATVADVVHEFTHPLVDFARAEAKAGRGELLGKINQIIDAERATWEQPVRDAYKDKGNETILEEIFTHAMGEKGADLFGKSTKTLQGRRWYNRLWEAIKGVWQDFATKMGWNKADLRGLERMSPEDAAQKILSEMAKGRNFGDAVTGGTGRAGRGAKNAAAMAKTRQSRKPGDEGYLTTARYDMEDSGEYHDIDSILSEFDGDVASGRKTRFWQKIPADEYQAALRKFMREGDLFDYPESKLRDWLNRMIGNTMDLETLTTLFSHSEYDPKGEVGEHYNKDFDKSDYSDFLEAKGFDEWGRLPDGSRAISDYGLRPLYSIFNELPSNPTPAEMMVAINRALDVVHARGDLSSIFIEGGRKRLSQISNDTTPDVRYSRRVAPSAPPPKIDMSKDESLKEKYLRNMSDRYDPLKRLVEEAKESAAKPSDVPDPYYEKRVQSGHNEADRHQIDILENKYVDFLKRHSHGQKEQEKLHEEVNMYLRARDALYRNRIIAERKAEEADKATWRKAREEASKGNTAPLDALRKAVVVDPSSNGYSGISTDQANKILDDFKRRMRTPILDQAFKIMQEVKDTYGLQRLVNGGMLDQATATLLENRNPDYAPQRTSRLDEEGIDRNSTRNMEAAAIKKALGRSTLSDNPVEFLFLQASDAAARTNENRTRQEMAKFVRMFPEVGKVRTVDKTSAYDLKTGKDAWIEDPHDVESENPLVVSFRENGKRMRIEFADTPRGRLLAESMRNEGVNRGPEAFDRMTRAWASTATQLSATFSGRNFQKDTVEVALNSAADTGFSGAGKFLKAQIAQMKPVVSTIREYLTKGTFGGPLGKEFKEFIDAGGSIGGMGREGYEDLKDTFSRKAKGLKMAFSGAHGVKEKVEAILGVTFGKIEDFNKTIEMMSRFNNYRSRRAKGESEKEAVIGAREDSTDFNMYGQQRWLNNVYMFSNSILGGTLRSTKQLATGKNGLKVATAVLAYGFVEAAADVLFNRGDDDEAEKSGLGGAKDLSERERSQTLYFRYGGKYFRIPVHGGPFSALKYTGGLLARAALGKLSWSDAAKNAAKEWATIGTHFGGAGEIDLTNGPKGIVSSFTPSVARPVAELGMNQDFAGRHIYAPEGFDRTTPKSERGFKSTGDGYKWFARLMNKVGGGNESRSADWSWFDNPPEAYKHIVEAVGKNMVRDIMLGGETVGRAVESAANWENRFTRDDVPFLRDVTRNVPDNSRRYYAALEDYERDKAEFKKTTPERRKEMKAAKPYLFVGKSLLDGQIEQVKKYMHLERGEIKVGQKWVEPKTPRTEAQKEEWRKKRLALQAQILERLGR